MDELYDSYTDMALIAFTILTLSSSKESHFNES